MKRFILLMGLCASLLVTNTVLAEGYFRAGGSSISGTGITAGINLNVVGGIEMSDSFALELDIGIPVVKAKSNGVDIGYQTTAGYAAFRSGSGTYFKAKAGLHSTAVTANGSTNTTSALAYGIGMGFGDGYEVEYTILAPETGSDNLTMISLTVMF